MNMKQVNNKISLSLLVYPDEIPLTEKKKFIKQRDSYRTGYEFSFIDDIVNQEELVMLIEYNAIKDLPDGTSKDLQGKIFERWIALILSNESNFDKWKNNNKTLVGLHYDKFALIMNTFSLNPDAVKKIEATSDYKVIGRLPTGGMPKTDILVTVHRNDSSIEYFSISCKRTNNKSVSVHQYKAEDFVRVLDKDNDKLRRLLVEFQMRPTLKKFGRDNRKELEHVIKPYRAKLALWVLGGIGGDGDSEKQWASHLLAYNNETKDFQIHTIEEYYDLLLKKNVKGHFGTVFAWTYASGARTKNIQLKCQIL
jgi:hypothetical protein